MWRRRRDQAIGDKARAAERRVIGFGIRTHQPGLFCWWTEANTNARRSACKASDGYQSVGRIGGARWRGLASANPITVDNIAPRRGLASTNPITVDNIARRRLFMVELFFFG